jgi:hypothetical protein
MSQALLGKDPERGDRCDSPELGENEIPVPIVLDVERPSSVCRKSSADLVLRPSRPASPPRSVSPVSTEATVAGTPRSAIFGVSLQPVPPHPPPSMPLPHIPRYVSPSTLARSKRASTGSVESQSSKRSSRSSGRTSVSAFSNASDPFHYDKQYGPASPGDRQTQHSGWSEWLNDDQFADYPEVPRTSRIKRGSATSLGAVSIASSAVLSPSLHSWTMGSQASRSTVRNGE